MFSISYTFIFRLFLKDIFLLGYLEGVIIGKTCLRCNADGTIGRIVNGCSICKEDGSGYQSLVKWIGNPQGGNPCIYKGYSACCVWNRTGPCSECGPNSLEAKSFDVQYWPDAPHGQRGVGKVAYVTDVSREYITEIDLRPAHDENGEIVSKCKVGQYLYMTEDGVGSCRDCPSGTMAAGGKGYSVHLPQKLLRQDICCYFFFLSIIQNKMCSRPK